MKKKGKKIEFTEREIKELRDYTSLGGKIIKKIAKIRNKINSKYGKEIEGAFVTASYDYLRTEDPYEIFKRLLKYNDYNKIEVVKDKNTK